MTGNATQPPSYAAVQVWDEANDLARIKVEAAPSHKRNGCLINPKQYPRIRARRLVKATQAIEQLLRSQRYPEQEVRVAASAVSIARMCGTDSEWYFVLQQTEPTSRSKHAKTRVRGPHGRFEPKQSHDSQPAQPGTALDNPNSSMSTEEGDTADAGMPHEDLTRDYLQFTEALPQTNGVPLETDIDDLCTDTEPDSLQTSFTSHCTETTDELMASFTSRSSCDE